MTESPREIFKRVASDAKKAPNVKCKPLRCGPYFEDGQSVVALIRTDNRVKGIVEALNLIGGLDSALAGRDYPRSVFTHRSNSLMVEGA